MSGVWIYGAGRGGEALGEALKAAGWGLNGFLDDDSKKHGMEVAGARVFPPSAKGNGDNVLLAISDRSTRLRLAHKFLRFGLRSFIENGAVVSETALMGKGTIIKAGSMIGHCVDTGYACLIDNGAIVCHHSKIGDAVHLAPGSICGGFVEIGDLAVVGTGSIVLTGCKVGEGAAIAPGSRVEGYVPPWSLFRDGNVIGRVKRPEEKEGEADDIGFVGSGAP